MGIVSNFLGAVVGISLIVALVAGFMWLAVWCVKGLIGALS